jgi:hypothetical protein
MFLLCERWLPTLPPWNDVKFFDIVPRRLQMAKARAASHGPLLSRAGAPILNSKVLGLDVEKVLKNLRIFAMIQTMASDYVP